MSAILGGLLSEFYGRLRSDGATKIEPVKLWDLMRYLERPL